MFFTSLIWGIFFDFCCIAKYWNSHWIKLLIGNNRIEIRWKKKELFVYKNYILYITWCCFMMYTHNFYVIPENYRYLLNLYFYYFKYWCEDDQICRNISVCSFFLYNPQWTREKWDNILDNLSSYPLKADT